MQLKKEDRWSFKWTDETWTFRYGSFKGREWQNDDIRSSSMTQANNGQRHIILHCGGTGGWIEGAALRFKSKTNDGDYHGEMNSDNFETWFKTQFLPNINEDTVLILDNASYHKRKVI